MPTSVSTILNRAIKKDGEPLNILTSCTHESFETSLAQTNANFYAIQGFQDCKKWTLSQRQVPKNYHILDANKGDNQIPINVDFDLVLSQNKFSQFPVLYQIAKQLQLPLVNIEHCMPMPNWSPQQWEQLNQMKGDINCFITNWSREKWGYNEENALVIHHGIDTKLFAPHPKITRKQHILTVGNDFINRGHLLGFPLWQKCTKDLPVRILGETRGLSSPTKNIFELVREYQSSAIYFNPSQISPLPMSLLEAASAGCAIVTSSTCAIPEFFVDGVNAFVSNDERHLRSRLSALLEYPDMADEYGQRARKIILEKFPLQNFVDSYNKVFCQAANMRYTGE